MGLGYSFSLVKPTRPMPAPVPAVERNYFILFNPVNRSYITGFVIIKELIVAALHYDERWNEVGDAFC